VIRSKLFDLGTNIKGDMNTSENQIDKASIAARLLNLILDVPVDQQLKLLKLLDDWKYKGARKHPRKQWVIPVDLATRDQTFKESIKDISNGGVFIETKNPFSTGEEVTLIFQLPNRTKPLEVIGKIVRSDPTGIGVRFKRHP
jgi:Tfp pilus assembly protein PilZ